MVSKSAINEGTHDESDFSEFNNSSQFGKCCVCWQLIIDEVLMCPECSGLTCSPCLQRLPRIAGKPKCPKCRSSRKEFARNRQVEELILSSVFKKKEMCETHLHERTIFCLDCKRAVCPICFYEGIDHKDHSKEVLEVLYRNKLQKVEDEIHCLDDNYEAFKRRNEEMQSRIEDIKNTEEEKIQKMQSFCNQTIAIALKSENKERKKAILET